MKLSNRTEYGVRAIVQLARNWPQKFVQSKDLAKKENLPAKFLESILLALRRGNFLESKIGREGGYRLSRAPKDISMGDVVRRLEGRLSVKEGRTVQEIAPGEIAVHLLNEQLTKAMDDVLNAMSLEELIEHIGKLAPREQGMYYI